jgi:hypothetical protein
MHDRSDITQAFSRPLPLCFVTWKMTFNVLKQTAWNRSRQTNTCKYQSLKLFPLSMKWKHKKSNYVMFICRKDWYSKYISTCANRDWIKKGKISSSEYNIKPITNINIHSYTKLNKSDTSLTRILCCNTVFQ